MESHDETGCQEAPKGPILCVNNCGFFGSSATMNMCSQCHKSMTLKQEQAQLAASSIDSIMSGSSIKDAAISGMVNVPATPFETKNVSDPPPSNLSFGCSSEVVKADEGPKRCNTCRKRVGLTGFNCKCGNHFCATHRYYDKHDCPFDYRAAAQDAIAKANPVVKVEKLDKI